jgi:hypothetical protein
VGHDAISVTMTEELKNQRRWQSVAMHIWYLTHGGIEPDMMPPSEDGGILIIIGQKSFHWYNFKASVCYDFGDADRPDILEGNRFVARFDEEPEVLAQFIIQEVTKP